MVGSGCGDVNEFGLAGADEVGEFESELLEVVFDVTDFVEA